MQVTKRIKQVSALLFSGSLFILYLAYSNGYFENNSMPKQIHKNAKTLKANALLKDSVIKPISEKVNYSEKTSIKPVDVKQPPQSTLQNAFAITHYPIPEEDSMKDSTDIGENFWDSIAKENKLKENFRILSSSKSVIIKDISIQLVNPFIKNPEPLKQKSKKIKPKK